MSKENKDENPFKDVLGPIMGDVLGAAFGREKNGTMVKGGWVDYSMGAAAMSHAIDVHFLGGDQDKMRTVPPLLLLSPTMGRYDNAMHYVACVQEKGEEHWLYPYIPPGDHSWLLKKERNRL